MATDRIPDYPTIEQGVGENSSNANVTNVYNDKSVAVICAALCAIAACFSAWAVYVSMRAEKETRLTQYYLMDPHSRTPEELAAWAKFNREKE